MAPEKLPKCQAWPSDVSPRVSITVTVVRTGRARRIQEIRAELRRRPGSRFTWVVLAAVTPLAAIAASALTSGRVNPATPPAVATQPATAAAVASAFGYPQRCLSITVSATDPDYATARVDRRGGCANYHGYVNASFHRVDGVWRLLLDEGQLFVPNALLAPGAASSYAASGMSGYSLGCVSLGVALHDPRFGQAAFDRTLPCVPDVR